LFKTRNKYGNKKIESDGLKFDSKLEFFCHQLLIQAGIDFEFQKQIILIDKFTYNGEKIRATTIVVDFVINNQGKTIYLDTKGLPTPVSILKYKMLKSLLKDEIFTDVVWVKTQKQTREYVNSLIKEKKNEH
jgi:hypothetical protein